MPALNATCAVLLGITARAAVASTNLVQDYRLDVTFAPSEARMSGWTAVTLDSSRVPDTDLVFYLHGELRVDSIKAGSSTVAFEEQPVFYEYDYSLIADEVRIQWLPRSTPQLEIWYSGYFHASNARSPSDYMRIDSEGVFLRCFAYSPWFPVFLPAGADEVKADFSSVILRTPAAFTSVFVGTKTGERIEDGQRITEWKASKVGLFAAQCTAQRYLVTSQGNYALYHYADTQSIAAAKTILSFANGLNDAYDRSYHHHPGANQFYLMEMPQFGDISSGNVTGLIYSTWQRFSEDENAKRALAHELVHPYVATATTRGDSLYCLAVEGFPSYFHLPVLAQSLGDDFYNRFLGWMEKLYLGIRTTGADNRGNRMPPEKPLLVISADELSTYKDEFVLSDRALLFLNYLYARMGEATFFKFTSDLFNQQALTTRTFRGLIEKYLPGSAGDVQLWLGTTEYPERFRFENFKRASGR
jgi:hypothetical protein